MLLETNPHFPGQPDSRDPQMQELFSHVNEILRLAKKLTPSEIGSASLKEIWARNKRQWMSSNWHSGANGRKEEDMSPISATIEIDTILLLEHLRKYAGANADFGELLPSREKTIIYAPKKKYRDNGDPYTGCLVALDYLLCRQNKSYEDRGKNLVIAFGDITILKDNFSISGPARIDNYVGPIRALYNSERKGFP